MVIVLIKRKMFLEELPKYESGANKGHIDWVNSIGISVHFIYDDIQGELPILDIIRKKNITYIVTEYRNCKNFSICSGSFTSCKIGELIGTYTKQYKFHVGDICTSVGHGRIEILEQKRMPVLDGTTVKGYKYKCLHCENKDDISENHLIKKKGCNVCTGKNVLKGYNDLWTTQPNIAKMLKYKQVGNEVSTRSNISQIFICPECHSEKEISPNNVFSFGLRCICGDKVSYPEKFVYSLLKKLNISFKTQLNKSHFIWCKNYKYDFYVDGENGRNIIIETHGGQHFKNTTRGRSLDEEQLTDKSKKELARFNGISDERYVVIDCSKSEMEFIKNDILNGKLAKLFDLSNIDWLSCHEYACNSLVKTVCDLWNEGYNASKISKTVGLTCTTISKYLKQGKGLGWCSYNAKSYKRTTVIICINTNVKYNSISEASEKLGITLSSITRCCKGERKSAGKQPETGEPLVWMYYEDYLKTVVVYKTTNEYLIKYGKPMDSQEVRNQEHTLASYSDVLFHTCACGEILQGILKLKDGLYTWKEWQETSFLGTDSDCDYITVN